MNTTVSTITTPTYSSGVAGLNGVVMIVFAAMIIFGVNYCATRLRSLVIKLLEFGGKLKCQYRANLRNELRKCVTTMGGVSPSEIVI